MTSSLEQIQEDNADEDEKSNKVEFSTAFTGLAEKIKTTEKVEWRYLLLFTKGKRRRIEFEIS